MDPSSNPFAPGAGTPPPELAGRSDVIRDVDIALGRLALGRPTQPLILVGLRGVGKTVLLNEIGRRADAKSFSLLRIEAHEGKSLPEALAPQLREALFAASRSEAARNHANRGLRVLRGFLGAIKVTVEGVTFGLGVDAEAGVADSGDLEADLPRLMEVVAEASQAAGRPILLLVDEIQYLKPREFSALIMGLHRINQRGLPLLMVAAGLPQTLALAGNSKSYAERLFRFPNVGALEPEAARLAIEAPAQRLGVRFAPEAVTSILERTQRYPYFLQQWAHDAWNAASGSTIKKIDVETATITATRTLDGSFFKVRFDRCTPNERRYMRALAELGPGVHRSSDVARALGVKVTDRGPVRDALIKKGMVYSPAHGDIAFTVPLFDEFMKRTTPP
jgi:hypothetical protein